MEHVNIELQGKIKATDYSNFVDTQSEIDLVETMKGKHGYFIKVSSKILPDTDGVRASVILGLKETKEGINWVEGGKLDKYLNAKGVKEPSDLVGLPCIIGMNKKDDGSSFLTI